MVKIILDASTDVLHPSLDQITLVFKKENPLHLVNYGSDSALSSIAKVFEKMMQNKPSSCENLP